MAWRMTSACAGATARRSPGAACRTRLSYHGGKFTDLHASSRNPDVATMSTYAAPSRTAL